MKTNLLAAALLVSATIVTADEKTETQTPTFIKNARQLTYEGRRAGEGYFSEDGTHLIFASERDPKNPFFQIFLLDLDSGDIQRVSPGTGKTTCAFFRSGTDEVLFASSHLDPDAETKQKDEIEFRESGEERRYSWDYDVNYDVFSSKRDGSNLTRLTEAHGYDAEAAYSPDGSNIIFCSIRDAYPVEKLSGKDKKRVELDPAYFAEIYIMDADGGNQTRLTDWPGYDGGPFFSPGGNRIVWRHFGEDGMLADVYTMRLDGSDRRQLTDFESMSWAPFYHPSGKYVIFTTNKLGFENFEIYIVDGLGRREPVRVTQSDGFDGLPVFSPDGRRISWTSNRHNKGGSSQLYIGDWDHEAALAALGESPMRSTADARFTPEISAVDLKTDVSYLASDELEGRMTGKEGNKTAARYIADRFKTLGLKTPDDGEGYFQDFPFTSGMKINSEGNHLEVKSDGDDDTSFDVDKDFRPLAFTSNGEVSGAVAFAGYGLMVPGDETTAYDSYSDFDVKDKIVLVLRYAPEEAEMERRQELNVYAGLRYKAMLARERGAKALLVVSGPNSPGAGELVPLKYDQSLANSGIIVASVSSRVAEALFAQSGKSLADVQDGLDIENPHVESTFDLTGADVRIATSVDRQQKISQNVIGILPPAGGDDGEYIVVGAHYDHIGNGEIGSLARKGEEGQIHNGADDNASGTAVVLELAARFADARTQDTDAFKRGVIFGLWSGEELGIIGSSHYVSNPVVPLERVVAYVNFDMVGRLRDNKLVVQGVGSSDLWTKLVEKRNVAAGFNVVLQEDPYLPTDVTAFYPKEVPVVSFFTGSHEDYNRPTDDPETLDYDGMTRIATFAHAIIGDLIERDERPQYAKVKQKKQTQGQRSSMRAYLGTIPDYANEGVEGVLLSGVRDGGPADKAGVQGGDIIVEFAGQKITNIYDYTYALGAVKIGKPVDIVVLRNSNRVALTIIPETRN